MCQLRNAEELEEETPPDRPRPEQVAPASRWSWPWRIIAAAAAGGASWAMLSAD
jgi:hypothetical protein